MTPKRKESNQIFHPNTSQGLPPCSPGAASINSAHEDYPPDSSPTGWPRTPASPVSIWDFLPLGIVSYYGFDLICNWFFLFPRIYKNLKLVNWGLWFSPFEQECMKCRYHKYLRQTESTPYPWIWPRQLDTRVYNRNKRCLFFPISFDAKWWQPNLSTI